MQEQLLQVVQSDAKEVDGRCPLKAKIRVSLGFARDDVLPVWLPSLFRQGSCSHWVIADQKISRSATPAKPTPMYAAK